MSSSEKLRLSRIQRRTPFGNPRAVGCSARCVFEDNLFKPPEVASFVEVVTAEAGVLATESRVIGALVSQTLYNG